MNWLAHLVLSSEDPEARLGNWLADILSYQEAETLSPGIARGVQRHRLIDLFTDRHPVHLRSRQRFPNGLRRLSGVLVDVVYDHFLSVNFSSITGQLLGPFTRQIYREFQALSPLMPKLAQDALKQMIAEDWLSCYQTLDGYELTLRRISRRLSPRAASRLDPAAARRFVEQEYVPLAEDFAEFFPQLRAATERA